MTCQNCNNTGKSPNSHFLDCGHCDTATERADLEAKAHHLLMTTHITPQDLYWTLYQWGKQAGAPM